MHRYQDTIDSRSVVSRRVRVTSAVERVNFSLGSALMHQSIETPTPWVPGKGRGFDIDPGQKASISLPPKARVQIKRPYP